MSIAALITEGIGPGGSILYAMTGGLAIGIVLNPWSPEAGASGTWTIEAAQPSTIWTQESANSTIWTPE